MRMRTYISFLVTCLLSLHKQSTSLRSKKETYKLTIYYQSYQPATQDYIYRIESYSVCDLWKLAFYTQHNIYIWKAGIKKENKK